MADKNGHLKQIIFPIDFDGGELTESNQVVNEWIDKGWTDLSYEIITNEGTKQRYIIHNLRLIPEKIPAISDDKFMEIIRLLSNR